MIRSQSFSFSRSSSKLPMLNSVAASGVKKAAGFAFFAASSPARAIRFHAVRIALHGGLRDHPITPGSKVAHYERAIVRDSPLKKSKRVFATVTFSGNKIEAHTRRQALTCRD